MSKASKEKKRIARKKGLRAHILTYIIMYGSILIGLTLLFGIILWWNQPLHEENTVEVTATVRTLDRVRHGRRSRRSYRVYITLSNGETYEKPQMFFVGKDKFFSSYEDLETALVGKTVTVTHFDNINATRIEALCVDDESILTLDETNEHRREGRVMWAVFYGIAVLLTAGCGVLFCLESAWRQYLIVPSAASQRRDRLRWKRRMARWQRTSERKERRQAKKQGGDRDGED